MENIGKSPFLMGKRTISMAIFNSYVSLPEGTSEIGEVKKSKELKMTLIPSTRAPQAVLLCSSKSSTRGWLTGAALGAVTEVNP